MRIQKVVQRKNWDPKLRRLHIIVEYSKLVHYIDQQEEEGCIASLLTIKKF